jgi:ABC-2 type transport system permease protein
MNLLRTALAFIKKDILITISYRFAFIMQIFSILVAVTTLYFLGSFVDSADLPFLKIYGGSYFGFLMIGVAFSDYAGISVNSFYGNIRDGQLTGTLEIILASPTRLFMFLFSSSLWSYIYTSFRLVIYFLLGIFVFKLEVGNANLPAAMAVFMLSIICFIAFGVIIASVVLVVKKGEGPFKAVVGISGIISGLLFPTDLLPPLLKKISLYIPFTYSFRGLRLSILQGHSIEQLGVDLIALFLFAVVLTIVSSIAFPYAVHRAKVNGSLAQY